LLERRFRRADETRVPVREPLICPVGWCSHHESFGVVGCSVVLVGWERRSPRARMTAPTELDWRNSPDGRHQGLPHLRRNRPERLSFRPTRPSLLSPPFLGGECPGSGLRDVRAFAVERSLPGEGLEAFSGERTSRAPRLDPVAARGSESSPESWGWRAAFTRGLASSAHQPSGCPPMARLQPHGFRADAAQAALAAARNPGYNRATDAGSGPVTARQEHRARPSSELDDERSPARH
jgi:hypothetical protein